MKVGKHSKDKKDRENTKIKNDEIYKHNKKIKINIGLLLFRIVSVVIIIIALAAICRWFIENQSNKKLLDEALSNVEVSSMVVDTDTYTVLNVDFENLQKTNNEIIGWVNLEGTNVNYPIVKGSDNDFYINHTFDKSYNSAGWIFADYRCKTDFSCKNTTIYGHNRRDSSMFASLNNILNEDWYSSNKNLTIATPEGNRIYQIFSVYKIKAESYYTTPDFSNDEEYLNFIESIKGRSIHDFEVTINNMDSIVTLSTCANDNNNRIVLHAKLLKIIPNK